MVSLLALLNMEIESSFLLYDTNQYHLVERFLVHEHHYLLLNEISYPYPSLSYIILAPFVEYNNMLLIHVNIQRLPRHMNHDKELILEVLLVVLHNQLNT